MCLQPWICLHVQQLAASCRTLSSQSLYACVLSVLQTISKIGLAQPGKIMRGTTADNCERHLHQLHVCAPSKKGTPGVCSCSAEHRTAQRVTAQRVTAHYVFAYTVMSGQSRHHRYMRTDQSIMLQGQACRP
jgi:hypothetical protein